MGLSLHTDWDQLLLQSESLAARDNQGFPRVERDIAQVEAFSSRLKAKARQLDSSADNLAATRLLAQEGINPRSLNRSLQTIELKPTYEDVFQVESSSVEEYLQQVHEMTVVTAIQEAQQDSIAAFESYMAQCMDADWAAGKRQLFDASLPDRTMSSVAAGPMSGPGLAVASIQQASATLEESSQATQLSGREKGYAEVVRALNAANLSRQGYNAVQHFRAAAAKNGSAGDHRRSTIEMLWSVLGSILQDAADIAPGQARTATMLRGARRYLEAGHVQHVQSTIQANRTQANLGGTPSRTGQVQAFLRMREKDSGPLDFDTPSGLDTTWHRIFLCLRSGYYQEAVEEAQRARDAPMMHGGSFAKHLQEWVKNDGTLPPESTTALAEECERQRAAADRSAWQRAGFRYKFAVHVLLAGNRKAADTLLREGGALFTTIEDFMWFMVTLVRSYPSAAAQGSGSSLRGTSGRLGDPYRLVDLQKYLNQYPPTHYSQNGKEPLLYATVLLLSLQFRAVITFLAKDSSTSSYRLDAPHFAIALFHHQALDAGGEGDAGVKQGVDPGQIIHLYGLRFAANAPEIALEYYMLAAQALGNDRQTQARLLRELLTESNAFGFLLGSGGNRGGALDSWLGSQQERQQLLEAVAFDCQRAAQLDWAAELYLYAGTPRPALHLLNLQISDLLEPSLYNTSQEELLGSLMRRGADAVAMLSSSSAAADEVETTAFRQLQTSRQLLQAQRQGDNMRAVQLLTELTFIPTDSFRLQRCTEAIPSLHGALGQRLPTLLLAAANALAAVGQVAQLRTVVAFAGNLPQRISQGTFQELNQVYNSIS